MGGAFSTENPTSSTNVLTTASADITHPTQRIVQNFLLVWADANIDQSKPECQYTLMQLQKVAHTVKIFTQSNQCIQFLNGIEKEKVFIITSGSLGQNLVPKIHHLPQLDVIYIFCGNKSLHEQWTEGWVKIRGVHTSIKPICKALQVDVQQCNQDSVSISLVQVDQTGSNTNLNELEPTYMYTQIFKEILLEMKYDKKAVEDLAVYCRKFYINNSNELGFIDEFERTYQAKLVIWWYTRQCFAYQMLNRALRELESDTIINMGFFICDLHKQIQELHGTQISAYQGKSFIVYRGQGLPKTKFEKLCNTKGGLISFNNFLSTSKKREVSKRFAMNALRNPDTNAILFKMTIDPSVSSTLFASIEKFSSFTTEEEILFSMHTVFRIDDIRKIADKNLPHEVDLTLTTDDDEQLRALTKRIREELGGGTGWQRLGALLIKTSESNKAEELYQALLGQTSHQHEKLHYFNQLGVIKYQQGNYKETIEYFEKSLEIKQKTLAPNHPSLATSYNNIGFVYNDMGEYSKALSSYEKALEICQKTLPPDHPSLATSYNNIAGVYNGMGEYSKALSSYEKSLEICQKTLPPDHPSLATSYNNIAGVYNGMGEYSKALSSYEKSLEIYQKTLPPNHPSLATSYNNIGLVYNGMGEYSKALSFYEKSLEIKQKTLPPDHPSLATSYNNIGFVYNGMGEYSKALSSYEKSLEICQKTLPPDHPSLATSYNNIAGVYNGMGEYSKALGFYEKSLEIYQKTLPPDHPYLASSYNGVGLVYNHMREYSKALSFCEKSLDIRQKSLSANHPYLAASFNNIGQVYLEMDEYSKALGFYEKSLDIRQRSLPANHPDLATSYNNIGEAYHNMEEYAKAFSFYEKSLEIRQKTLPSNHPDLAISYNNFGNLCDKTGEYSKALSYLKRALDIKERSLSPNHPSIQNVRRSIENITKKL